MLETPSPAGVARPFGWRFTTPLFVGSALNPINSSLIATALVPIAAGVHVAVGRTAVLVSAPYLASAIAQPTAGKGAEVFGPRRVVVTGIFWCWPGDWSVGSPRAVAPAACALGTASSNQLALYDQADAGNLGTASGLMRSFGYLGSIASSAVTGIVYRDHVSDSGVVTIGWIMIGVGVALLLITVLDRTLHRTANA